MNTLFIKIDDFCNALLVKELRQSVRGKYFWSIFGIFLAILCGLFLFANSDRFDNDTGSEIIEYLINCLLFCCFLLFPLSIGRKITKERNDGTNELLLTTTMTSKQIIMGKFLCGCVQNTMMFCTVAPFCLLTVLMGGVDANGLLLVMFFGYILSLLAVMIQVVVGLEICTLSTTSGQIVKIVSFILQFIGWLGASAFIKDIQRHGFTWFSKDNYTIGLIVAFIICLGIWFLLYKFGFSLLEPVNSNTSYSLRIYMSILWLISIIVCFGFEDLRIPFIVTLCIVIGIISGMIHNEPESYSERIKKEIPDSFMMKLIKFPFFTGWTNGMAWVLLTLIANMGVFAIFKNTFYNTSFEARDFMQGLEATILISLWVSNYCMLGDIIRKIFFKNKSRKENLGFAFSLYLLIGFIPSIVWYRQREYGFIRELLSILNPFLFFTESKIEQGVVVCGIVSVLLLLINIRPIGRQIYSYFTARAISIDKENNNIEK